MIIIVCGGWPQLRLIFPIEVSDRSRVQTSESERWSGVMLPSPDTATGHHQPQSNHQLLETKTTSLSDKTDPSLQTVAFIRNILINKSKLNL